MAVFNFRCRRLPEEIQERLHQLVDPIQAAGAAGGAGGVLRFL